MRQMKFGSNLMTHRKRKGYTQEDLAELMQVSRQTISKWENGDALPEFVKVVKLADLLEVSIDELCGRNRIEKSTEKIEVEHKVIKHISKTRWLFFMVILVIVTGSLLWIMGKGNQEPYQLPDNIAVSGVEFSFNNYGKVVCRFVPEIYSEDLEYTVIKIKCPGTEFEKQFEIEVTFKNGIGMIETGCESENYTFVLRVSNGEESRNTALAENIYVNREDKIIYYHE